MVFDEKIKLSRKFHLFLDTIYTAYEIEPVYCMLHGLLRYVLDYQGTDFSKAGSMALPNCVRDVGEVLTRI